MPLQLTPEQERRIQSFVDSGSYNSVADVVDAALVAFEQQANPGFEGTQEELEALLLEGLHSGEPVEANDDCWNRLRSETDLMIAEHQSVKRRS
jgi:putative addiction module CopG family antidote